MPVLHFVPRTGLLFASSRWRQRGTLPSRPLCARRRGRVQRTPRDSV